MAFLGQPVAAFRLDSRTRALGSSEPARAPCGKESLTKGMASYKARGASRSTMFMRAESKSAAGDERASTRRDVLRIMAGIGLGLGLPSAAMADLAQLQNAPRLLKEGERIYDTRVGSFLPVRAAMEHLPRYLRGDVRSRSDMEAFESSPVMAQKRVLVVGEEHTHPLHHRLQLDVIKALRRADPSKPLSIGMEHFHRQHQSHLDDYIDGRIGLSKLKERTKWNSTWGYDFNHWLPIFAFARQNRIRLVGLNLPSEAVQLVAQNGLDRVPEKLRLAFPQVDLTDQKHYEQFATRMLGAHAEVGGSYLKSYYEAFCLWEEYMADSASRFLLHAPGFKDGQGQMVILAGAGHVEGRRGIPNRLARRMDGEDVFTILPKSVSFTAEGLPQIAIPEKRDVSDWVWYTRRPVDLV